MSHDHNHAHVGAGTTLTSDTAHPGLCRRRGGRRPHAQRRRRAGPGGGRGLAGATAAFAAAQLWSWPRRVHRRADHQPRPAGPGGLADGLRRRAFAATPGGAGRGRHHRHRPRHQPAGGLAIDARREEPQHPRRAALLHVLGDLPGSVAALLSGLVIAFTGWMPIDPLLSLAIGALILVSSLRLLRESLHGLMEGAPFNVDPEAVGRALPGVASMHDLHIWAVKAEQPLLSAHLVVRDIAHLESVMETSHTLLAEQFGIHHATLQPEPMTRTVHWRKPTEHDHDHEHD